MPKRRTQSQVHQKDRSQGNACLEEDNQTLRPPHFVSTTQEEEAQLAQALAEKHRNECTPQKMFEPHKKKKHKNSQEEEHLAAPPFPPHAQKENSIPSASERSFSG
eukprot:CAMPEP_0206243312 /NCGR_PEP_ID=MMETSP0047_2-20121206/17543_1 /ASSEMBLY_ACC=CAM_ASM_000192 /TAXON_ID=195065 /ORGANISM="Chroomonas mesostigmatica_cf, Strain CCMP1168" /LENGTH=105 /DNA_ID=CAMNT_0053668429 /DNA_START=341 /DNA_END=659 /DNA_ORIENTATION=+